MEETQLATIPTQTVPAIARKTREIRPQPKQNKFLSTTADIAIYGGAAGGGKTFGLLLESTRHTDNGKFRGVIFRRTTKQIKTPGGIWDESYNIYPSAYGRSVPSTLRWRFRSGARIEFHHLEYEKDVETWQSAQLAFIGFEELTQFTEKQFFYMLSRSRSTSGVRPYVRCTTNPDPDSFVRKLIDWWIGKDGFPIESRSGVIRYFGRDGDRIVWGGSREEVVEEITELDIYDVKSFTFIPAKLEDNQELTKIDKGYRGNLLALAKVDREQLLDGNWDVRPMAGDYFQREWVVANMIDYKDLPEDIKLVRAWDLAATDEKENKRADCTAKVLMGVSGKGKDRKYYIIHADEYRKSPHKVEQDMLKTAERDGKHVRIRIPQDPGQAGKAQVRALIALLSGYRVSKKIPSGKKGRRFSPCSAQIEGRNVYIVRGLWNENYFKVLESFSGKATDSDDLVDATSDAFDLLSVNREFSAG